MIAITSDTHATYEVILKKYNGKTVSYEPDCLEKYFGHGNYPDGEPDKMPQSTLNSLIRFVAGEVASANQGGYTDFIPTLTDEERERGDKWIFTHEVLSPRPKIGKYARQMVYSKYNGHCAYCGEKLEYKDMQVDHIDPYIRGGMDNLSNYNPACRSCNFYKDTMTVEQFREQLGKLVARLHKVFIFRLALKHGLVKITDKPVEFYFEKFKSEGKS